MFALQAQPSSGLLVRYPYISASYNDKTTSDLTLCFGDNEKIHAHKVLLQGASGVFNRAFNSLLPVATKTEFQISEHPSAVVYAMVKYIYGSPLEAPPGMVAVEDQIDYLFNIFAIANEYEIPSLGEAATQRIFQIMKMCYIDSSSLRLIPCDQVLQERKQFGSIVAKTAHLYMNYEIADRCLMDGVIEACFELTPGLVWLEDNIHLSGIIEALDPFSGRLLRQGVFRMRRNSAVTRPFSQPWFGHV